MRITSRGRPLCPRDSGGLLGRQRQDPPPTIPAIRTDAAPTPLSPTIREITLGETINADIAVAGPPCTTTHGWPVPCHYNAFTPSADGTVTATFDLGRSEDRHNSSPPYREHAVRGVRTFVVANRGRIECPRRPEVYPSGRHGRHG
jgi:hypothetical protein